MIHLHRAHYFAIAFIHLNGENTLPAATTLGAGAAGENKVTRFLFQRQHEDSHTGDKSGAYSQTVDIDLPRNQDLVKYLQDVTSKPFPGYGGQSFEAKYQGPEFGGDTKGRDQILVEIFDYIRTVNLRDSTRDKNIVKNVDPTTKNLLTKPADIPILEQYKYAPRGLVLPSRFGAGKNVPVGMGRFPTISEAAIVFYHSGYVGTNGKRYFLLKEMAADKTKPKRSLVRAFMVFETFNPMQGFAPTLQPNSNSLEKRKLVFEVTGLKEFTLSNENGPQSLNFPESAYNCFNYSGVWGSRNSGGSEGFYHTMVSLTSSNGVVSKYIEDSTATKFEPTDKFTPPYWYPFQSMPDPLYYTDPSRGPWLDPNKPSGIDFPYTPLTPSTQAPTYVFSGGKIKLVVKFDKIAIHTITLEFPKDIKVPLPQDYVWGDAPAGEAPTANSGKGGDPGGFVPVSSQNTWASTKSNVEPRMVKSLAGRLGWVGDGNSDDRSNPIYYNPVGANASNRWRNILQPGDVVRSVVYGKGDLRSSCLSDDSSVFQQHPDYISGSTVAHAQTLRTGSGSVYFSTNSGASQGLPWGNRPDGAKIPDTNFGNIAKLPLGISYPTGQSADIPRTINGAMQYTKSNPSAKYPGDFDTGLGNLGDGPFCNKADEGNLAWRTEQLQFIPNANGLGGTYKSYDPKHWSYQYPYFTWVYDDTFETFFTPNRQVPSAVLFGSLPSGKDAYWQTLCFSPNPAAADNHPGRTDPKDYLWLDLFTMPVVEPYAISEPFSTAGKINMNYQIVPFTNIKRSTGMRAALQPVRVTAIPASDVLFFKTGFGNATTVKPSGTSWPTPKANVNYRYVVNRDETLKAFDDFFAQYSSDRNKGFFKSAAEICDRYLYPKRYDTTTLPSLIPLTFSKGEASIKNWWKTQTLTGDNVREKPYADLYPRLTTKSNTYCVHVRAQALRQSAAPDPSKAASHYLTWDERRDRVIGEYRGSSIIERYIDPQDERFNPLANKNAGKGGTKVSTINVDKVSLDDAYRFRVLNTKRFSP